MENPMIIVAILIFVVLGGIAFYYFVIREDEPTATTAPSGAPAGDLAGNILAGFNDNFTNIKKRVEHFTVTTPGPRVVRRSDGTIVSDSRPPPCASRTRGWNPLGTHENGCHIKNSCQFTYYSGSTDDEYGCAIYDFVPHNTNIPNHYEPLWIDSQKRMQPINNIPACTASPNYASNLGSLTDGFVDMTLNNLLELSIEEKAKNFKNLLKEPFLRASSIIDNFINLVPYITVYDCGTQNLPCECDGVKQYIHDYNIHTTNEEKALVFVTLMFGYDENISFESNLTRIEGNIWLMWNKLIQTYGEPFCLGNINNIKAYVTDFNNAISNDQAPPDFIVSDDIVATIALVFSTVFIGMNAGMLGNPRNNNDDNDMRFDFINEGTNVNIIERYKYKLSMPHITIPPEARGSSFGLHELEEGSRFTVGDPEYIEMIPLFMMITKSVVENEDSIYNLLTCP